MSTSAVVSIRTDAQVKTRAQAIAEELGLSLSAVVNALLRQFVRTESLRVSVRPETPSDYMVGLLRDAETDLESGNVSPVFDGSSEAIKWLHHE